MRHLSDGEWSGKPDFSFTGRNTAERPATSRLHFVGCGISPVEPADFRAAAESTTAQHYHIQIRSTTSSSMFTTSDNTSHSRKGLAPNVDTELGQTSAPTVASAPAN
ncbi:hypothetical protein EVAR_87373_1 [Eumeta japonica]|uniref:Uncharacterized protein n=1 Tax=Eumeta variegata TaxID=151549 RepID=A0A4C1Y288_EUMVA|nr:hypothetical protein EVAR_87373_1 [Eumeta japonica]